MERNKICHKTENKINIKSEKAETLESSGTAQERSMSSWCGWRWSSLNKNMSYWWVNQCVRVEVCDGVGVCVLQGVIEIHIMLVSLEENLLLFWLDLCKDVKRGSRKCFDVDVHVGSEEPSHMSSTGKLDLIIFQNNMWSREDSWKNLTSELQQILEPFTTDLSAELSCRCFFGQNSSIRYNNKMLLVGLIHMFSEPVENWELLFFNSLIWLHVYYVNYELSCWGMFQRTDMQQTLLRMTACPSWRR